jgi:diphthine-ammonia ligase
MTSLAYLWQRDQVQLLKEMLEWPINAIVVKVCSYGLQAKHLGAQLSALQPLLIKLKQSCGMNVCGEGGEYETIVLDCPLFRQSIVM